MSLASYSQPSARSRLQQGDLRRSQGVFTGEGAPRGQARMQYAVPDLALRKAIVEAGYRCPLCGEPLNKLTTILIRPDLRPCHSSCLLLTPR
jgi:hypothetical protein